ncbi:KR domain-containing protein [Francisella noatunensis]
MVKSGSKYCQLTDRIDLDMWSNEKANISGTYIVTGGTQGFGFYTAMELAKYGATKLILINHRGTIFIRIEISLMKLVLVMKYYL